MTLNLSDDERDNLLGQIYGGYHQTNPKPVYEMKGAGSGRRMVQTGTKTSTNYDAYENDPLWQKVAKDVGITGAINNQQELGVMANRVANYGKDEAPEVPEEVAPEETPEPESATDRERGGNAGERRPSHGRLAKHASRPACLPGQYQTAAAVVPLRI